MSGTAPGRAAAPSPERDALQDIARAAQGSIDTSLPLDRDWLVNRALDGLGWLPDGWPEPEARPALAAAPTPGQAAYEAFMGSLTGRCPDVPVVTWERLDDLARDGYASGDTQADWDAAAQAAIEVAYAPCPDCGCAPRPHGAFCYGCGACLDVLAQHEPGSAGIGPGEIIVDEFPVADARKLGDPHARITREHLGRIVREAWVQWAREQPGAKPSWLLPWELLDDGQREADMRIGEAVADAAIDESESTLPAQLAMAREAISDLAEERDRLRARIAELEALLADARAEFAAAADLNPAASEIKPRPGEPGWFDVTCDVCDEKFSTNLDAEEISCTNCEARRCPHCGTWFGAELRDEEGQL